jgi:hypothetical protein
VEDAKKIVRELTGIDLPSRIDGVIEANQIVDRVAKTSLRTSEKFYTEALKYNIKK